MQLKPRRRALTLTLLSTIGALLGASATARADGTVTMRGAYYKERSTRVVQPMVDGAFQVGDHGTAEAHLLVDAITSASASSGAADTAFTERRYEGGAGYAHELDWGKLRGEFRVSREPDYLSAFISGGAELAFAEDNTIVALGGGLGQDDVSNAGARGPFTAAIEDSLRSVLGAVSVSQVLSKNALAAIGYDVSHLRGYQQNPYRMVTVGGSAFPEMHPGTRTRHAVAATVKTYLPRTGTTVIGSYRLYLDSWGVLANTPELRALQPVGDVVELGLRYRFHQQSAADFFERVYATEERYLSDDEKLSAFTTHTIEGKLAVRGEALGLRDRWADARGELLLQYIDQNNRFGDAVAAQVALTLPLAY